MTRPVRTPEPSARFDEWLAALDERHLATLTATEVGRALRALSSCYVERREKLASGAALEGAGKRAAFALFYGVQHFLMVRSIAADLFAGTEDSSPIDRVADLGCGTGAAGAALALATGAARIEGIDVSRWAVAEANWTYRFFGLRGRAIAANLASLRPPRGGLTLAAYAINELPEDVRRDLLARLLAAHGSGSAILIVEPIARRLNGWWTEWAKAFAADGGREDEWRFPVALPERQRALARSAGLDVRELTARSLFLRP
jgi:hypothetical protein